ncbi:hypothetical protein D3C87_1935120 [compost metagenome]
MLSPGRSVTRAALVLLHVPLDLVEPVVSASPAVGGASMAVCRCAGAAGKGWARAAARSAELLEPDPVGAASSARWTATGAEAARAADAGA